MPSKRKLIVGNWKVNPDSAAEAKRIIKETKKAVASLKRTDVVACPPYVYSNLVLSAKSKTPLELGVQNVWTEPRGSFTGEIGAPMLRDIGVSWVIIGHSERRAMGETDEQVAKKSFEVIEAGMNAIVCVGEKVHDAQGAYLDPLKEQIRNSLSKISKKSVKQLVIAYEPVWAIGAKDAMDPAVVQEMTIFIKKVLSDIYGQDEASSVRILYGGSANFRNAPEIITKGGVDGLLVGRESVNPSGFAEMLKVVDAL
ncbi:MAG: triosephosphate isomerase, triosephosphate isomerase [Candidatus Taylorbacteria bacterium]|nr:triosephosphate isomerase, triosephosphate isomerase [Candidatus Taylorbacteria bacterium]